MNEVSRQSACRFHAGVLPVPARRLASGAILLDEPAPGASGVAVYARVLSGGKRADLDRQVVSKVGSGLNGHRSKLLGLLRDPSVARQ